MDVFLRDKTTLQRLLGIQLFCLARHADVPRASSRIPALACERKACMDQGRLRSWRDCLVFPGFAVTIVGSLLCCGVGIFQCLFSLLYYVIWRLRPSSTPRNYYGGAARRFGTSQIKIHVFPSKLPPSQKLRLSGLDCT